MDIDDDFCAESSSQTSSHHEDEDEDMRAQLRDMKARLKDIEAQLKAQKNAIKKARTAERKKAAYNAAMAAEARNLASRKKALTPAHGDQEGQEEEEEEKDEDEEKEKEEKDEDEEEEEEEEEEIIETVEYKTGLWSQKEKDQVSTTIESVRRRIGLSVDDMKALIKANPKISNDPHHTILWDAVQKACPTRARQKLIDWSRRHFNNYVAQGTWNEEQDEELMEMVRTHGTQWAKIARVIDRHPEDVRDRYRNYLVYGERMAKHAWSVEEENKLFEVMEKKIDEIRSDPALAANIKDDEAILRLINWHQISEGMGLTRSRLQCSEKWKRLGAQDAIPDRIAVKLPSGLSSRLKKARKELRSMGERDKVRLVTAIQQSGATKETEIVWQDIMERTFDGAYQRHTLLVTWGRLRAAVPDWETKTTSECAAYVLDIYKKDNTCSIPTPKTSVNKSMNDSPSSLTCRSKEAATRAQQQPEQLDDNAKKRRRVGAETPKPKRRKH